MLKKYDILYIDPPWKFNARSNTNTKFGGGAMKHYPTMTMSEIKKLDFSLLLKDNGLAYVWVTLAKLPECINAIQSKDLQYATTGFVWVKLKGSSDTPTDTHRYYMDDTYYRPFFGVGNYTASNAEICLIFRKNKMIKYEQKVSQIIISKIEEHSKKPKEAYDLLNTMYPNADKLEIFARNSYEGFDSIGNQFNDMDIKEVLKLYSK